MVLKNTKKCAAKINTENPDPDPIKLRMLDPDPYPDLYIMYTDPKSSYELADILLYQKNRQACEEARKARIRKDSQDKTALKFTA